MGDRTRPVTGDIGYLGRFTNENDKATGTTGVFSSTDGNGGFTRTGTGRSWIHLNSARVTPTGSVNTPRSWGALACTYFGVSA